MQLFTSAKIKFAYSLCISLWTPKWKILIKLKIFVYVIGVLHVFNFIKPGYLMAIDN